MLSFFNRIFLRMYYREVAGQKATLFYSYFIEFFGVSYHLKTIRSELAKNRSRKLKYLILYKLRGHQRQLFVYRFTSSFHLSPFKSKKGHIKSNSCAIRNNSILQAEFASFFFIINFCHKNVFQDETISQRYPNTENNVNISVRK